MSVSFIILAGLTLAGAVGALALRNLVHCALSLVVALVGLALLYLRLGAEFVGLAQVLVYVGAVSILIVFAILLTRGCEPPAPAPVTISWGWGLAAAMGVFGVMALTLLKSPWLGGPLAQEARKASAGALARVLETPPPSLPVRALGEKLMSDYVVPLEALGLLLTAALIGAVLIAMPERKETK
jgi:NADH-quinone oxidoreductase subunit J